MGIEGTPEVLEGSGGVGRALEVWKGLEWPSVNLGGVGRVPQKSGRGRQGPGSPVGVGRAPKKFGRGREGSRKSVRGREDPGQSWRIQEGYSEVLEGSGGTP